MTDAGKQDWIEWKGGENPIPGELFFEARRRDGREVILRRQYASWDHANHPSDIIAYRVAAGGEAGLAGYAGVKDAEVNNQGGEPEDWRPVDAEEAARLRSVIYRLLERHDASPEVLSIAGSLFDTLPVSDCIDLAEDWLSSGEIMSGEQ